MARKVKCKNTECKHHCKNDYCDTTVNINSGGRCESFEKNIVYYIHLVWEALANKNFIDMIEIIRNPEIKIGLFYVQPGNLQKAHSESMKNQQRKSARRKALKQSTEHGEKKNWVQEK